MKPSRRNLTLKGLERTLHQIYLENYALHKARPYPIIEEENNSMLVADGGEGWKINVFSAIKSIENCQKINQECLKRTYPKPWDN